MQQDTQQHQAVIAQALAQRTHARIPCPACSPRRKKKTEPCLSADRTFEGAMVWNCHHCGWSGSTNEDHKDKNRRPNGRARTMSSIMPKEVSKEAAGSPTTHATVVPLNPSTLTTLDAAYLASRGLTEPTIKLAGLFSTRRYFNGAKAELPCIAFPYRTDAGNPLANKYRTDNKHFTQDSGGATTFYGADRLNDSTTMLIAEGEIDALSLTEAGFDNAVSVPNGAPMRIVNRRIDPAEDVKFAYVWDSRELLDRMDRIVLVTDADAQGEALREELARRIGKHKCWVVSYPQGCKDANDVLRKHGKVTLSDCIIDAKPYPISSLYRAKDFSTDIESLYNKRSVRGVSTGFATVDPFYTVYPGQVTIVTGLPSMGKSSWVDQVCVNLANQFSWKTALCSFENTPTIHIAHLMELKIGKPFFQHPGHVRIDEEEYKAALEWVEAHFGFIDFRDTEPPTIENILSRAQAAVQRLGVRGVVIDPYNYIKMERSSSETDEISNMLSRVQAFAKANDCHVWFVAHPTKMYGSFETTHPIPGGMNVHGSMSWWSKADCGISVHRGERGNETLIDVWKVRYRWVGQQGRANVSYDPVCGGFSS